MPTVTPFLWFDGHAEDAMNFYASIFGDAKIISVSRAQGVTMSVEFELLGQRFIGLNGGPFYKFNEAVSFLVSCDTQADIDHYWTRLLADGGEEGRCGWLKDKFGLSWQIVPLALSRLIGGPDGARAKRALDATMKMQKLDIDALQHAYDDA